MVKKLLSKLFGSKKKKVLVFDEDAEQRKLMDIHMDNLGYEAVPAESQEEVEKLLSKSPSIDMLLFSISKKKRDAVTFAKDLRKRNNLRRIPLLFANQDFAPTELERLTESIPNSRALSKPFSVTQLRDSMRDMLNPKDATPESTGK